MLANVFDIDYHSMQISLAGIGGVVSLFDFAVAFPSISQEFLLDRLTCLQLPH